MRRLWWILILFLGLGFLLRYREAVLQALWVLREGEWLWVGLAFLFQMGWLMHTALLLWGLYRTLAIPESPWRLAIVVISSLFINLAAPTGGVSGVAIFAADAHRRGRSASRALVAGTLYIFFEHSGFLAVMFVGLWVLLRRGRLTWTELSAAAVMVLLVLGLFGVMALGIWAPVSLERFVVRGAHWQSLLAQRLHLQRWAPGTGKARAFIQDLTQGLQILKQSPKALLRFFLMGSTNKIWHLGVMACAFYAFHLPLSPGTLLGAYVIVHLFFVVSPVPGGIGFAEGALVVLLHSFGFALHDAFVVTLTYRAVTFWIPFLFGMVGFRYLVRSTSKVRSDAVSKADSVQKALLPMSQPDSTTKEVT